VWPGNLNPPFAAVSLFMGRVTIALIFPFLASSTAFFMYSICALAASKSGFPGAVVLSG